MTRYFPARIRAVQRVQAPPSLPRRNLPHPCAARPGHVSLHPQPSFPRVLQPGRSFVLPSQPFCPHLCCYHPGKPHLLRHEDRPVQLFGRDRPGSIRDRKRARGVRKKVHENSPGARPGVRSYRSTSGSCSPQSSRSKSPHYFHPLSSHFKNADIRYRIGTP